MTMCQQQYLKGIDTWGRQVRAAREECKRQITETVGREDSEMKLLKVGSNGSTDPRVNWVPGERIGIDMIAWETELPNDAWATKREDSFDENGERHKFLVVFVVWTLVGVLVAVVVEIEDVESLPEMAAFARDEAHVDGGFGREEGENVT